MEPVKPDPITPWMKLKLRFRYLYWQRVPQMLRHPFEYAYDHIVNGARPVKTGQIDAYKEAQGELVEDGIDIQFGGACPVQGEGTVDGRQVYYRSRGSGWQFHVAPEGAADALGDDAWCFEEYRYHWPDGGWVHADVSRECIRRAVSMWRSAGRP